MNYPAKEVDIPLAAFEMQLSIRRDCKPVHITRIEGNDVEAAPREDFMSKHCSVQGMKVNVVYKYKRTFREVLHTFSSSGSMKASLLTMLSASSVEELRNEQPDDSVLRQSSQVSDSVLLTLAAIKILTKWFPEHKKVWHLVEKKARKFVLSNSSLTKETINNALDALDTTFQPNY